MNVRQKQTMSPDQTAQIATKKQFTQFVAQLNEDYARNGKDWENQDLARFLDALHAWLESSDGYYRNRKIDIQTVTPWRRLADALAAARAYE